MQTKLTTQSIGKEAEILAGHFYCEKGFLILERNYRYGRAEVDLILKNKDLLVFVEVKARRNEDFGTPENFMSKAQQTRVLKAADQYIYIHNWMSSIRFDILAVSISASGQYVIEQFEDAFY